MVNRGYRWFAAVGVGMLVFAFGMVEFASAVRVSHRYDRVEAEARGRAAYGRPLDSRGVIFLLGVLGQMRQETHVLLARGLFSTAGGMALMALGGQELLRRRRQRDRTTLALGSSSWVTRGGRCVALPAERRRTEAPEGGADLDDEETLLLARFEALERRAALEAR
jgi:hypothetical protein